MVFSQIKMSGINLFINIYNKKFRLFLLKTCLTIAPELQHYLFIEIEIEQIFAKQNTIFYPIAFKDCANYLVK